MQAVERSIDIFEQLAHADGELGVSELSHATGLPVGTVHRLLSTLQARGYVRQNPRTRRYMLGYQVLALARRILSREGLRAAARPYLRELMLFTGETVNLAIIDSHNDTHHVMYVCQEQSFRMVRTFTEIGYRAPLHSTGTGKVLLAFLPSEQLTACLSALELVSYTAKTITDLATLHRALDDVRLYGYAIDDEEHEEGVRCIAAPVVDLSGQTVAAVSISGPINRVTHEKQKLFMPHLKRCADEISRALGYHAEIEPPMLPK